MVDSLAFGVKPPKPGSLSQLMADSQSRTGEAASPPGVPQWSGHRPDAPRRTLPVGLSCGSSGPGARIRQRVPSAIVPSGPARPSAAESPAGTARVTSASWIPCTEVMGCPRNRVHTRGFSRQRRRNDIHRLSLIPIESAGYHALRSLILLDQQAERPPDRGVVGAVE